MGNRNPLYPKQRSRIGTTRTEKKRMWKFIFCPSKAMTSYCFCVESLGIQHLQLSTALWMTTLEKLRSSCRAFYSIWLEGFSNQYFRSIRSMNWKISLNCMVFGNEFESYGYNILTMFGSSHTRSESNMFDLAILWENCQRVEDNKPSTRYSILWSCSRR